jgi:hypothetical protein
MTAKSNLQAAKSGDHLQALEVARDTAAAAIDQALSRGDGTVAQLIAQYRGVLSEIAGIKAAAAAEQGRGVTELERIRARREARSDVAADRPRAARRGKSGTG